jgi:hypothetical protein
MAVLAYQHRVVAAFGATEQVGTDQRNLACIYMCMSLHSPLLEAFNEATRSVKDMKNKIAELKNLVELFIYCISCFQ